MSRRKGFTLVELLVVIGIIAVLIGVLMPALTKARKLSQRAQCLAQMKQIGTALMMYVAENKGRTPIQVYNYVPHWGDPAQYDQPAVPSGAHLNGRNAFATLLTFLGGEKRVFVCPAAYDFSWFSAADNPTALSDTSYMGNQSVYDRRLSKIRKSSEVIYLQENRHRWNIAWLRPALRNPPDPVTGPPPTPAIYSMWCWDNPNPRSNGQRWGQEYSSIHDDGGNLVYVDGHAEWRRHLDLKARDFGLTGGPGVGGTENDPSTTDHGQTYYSMFE